MCGSGDVTCEVKVIALEEVYQVKITGDKVKDALKVENLKQCIEPCCPGEAPVKDIRCR